MTTTDNQGAREILPVRLSEEERVLAEALTRMHPCGRGAGAGVRLALRMAQECYERDGHGDRLERYRLQISERRAQERADGAR